MRALFDDEHEAFRNSARRFMQREVVPHLDGWRAGAGLPRSVLLAAGEEGLLGTAVPEEYGGGGVDDVRFLVVLLEEAMGVGATGLALVIARHSGLCLPLLLRHADPLERSRWITGLAGGRLVGAVGGLGPATELHGTRLTATLRAVPAGAEADLVLTAVAGPSGPPCPGLLPAGHGVERVLVTDSLGARDAALADVTFAEVTPAVLPAASLVELRRDADLWAGVLAVAGARAALVLTVDYVRERKVFGRALSSFENTRGRLAEISARLAAAEMLVDAAVRALADGTLDPADAARARASAAAAHDLAADQGLQLHGGYGYMREYPIAHAFADARFLRLHEADCSDARATVAAGLGL